MRAADSVLVWWEPPSGGFSASWTYLLRFEAPGGAEKVSGRLELEERATVPQLRAAVEHVCSEWLDVDLSHAYWRIAT